MSKVCSKCKVEKDESEFYASSVSVDGLDYYCKECRKEDSRSRYRANPKHYHDFQYENREFIESLKTKCSKCGEDRPWVIHFHHINPKDKRFGLSNVGTRSRASIWKEASKCVCLCANCHYEFHHFFGQQPNNPIESFEMFINEDY